MSLRSFLLVPLVAGALLTPLTAAGDRLLVAGPDGLVMQADSVEGVFDNFAFSCGGPIRSLTADSERLYASSELNWLMVFDVESGALQNFLSPGIGTINAISAGDGVVFAGTAEGLVARLDPLTGQPIDKRIAPAAVDALLVHDGFLFVASGGAIYRAPTAAGELEYFSCFCFSGIRGLAWDRGDLVIGDENGIVARANGQTGELLAAFWVGPTNVMAKSRGELLLYYDGGTIPLVNAMTGSPTRSLESPIAVNAMLVIPAPPKTPRFVGGKGPQRP